MFRHSDTEFFMTAAEPNLGYLRDLIGRLDVEIEDVSDDYGMLAVQGPRSREILRKLAPEVADLALLRAHADAKIGRRRGDGVAHRLHRRPRLRGHASAPTTRSACSTRSSRPGRATASARSARTRC